MEAFKLSGSKQYSYSFSQHNDACRHRYGLGASAFALILVPYLPLAKLVPTKTGGELSHARPGTP